MRSPFVEDAGVLDGYDTDQYTNYKKIDPVEPFIEDWMTGESFLNLQKIYIQNEIIKIAKEEIAIWKGKNEFSNSQMQDHVKRYWKASNLNDTYIAKIIGERIQDVKNKKEPRHPWSSAFITYVMRKASREKFIIATAHNRYVIWAKKKVESYPFYAFPMDAVLIEVGDIIVNARETKGQIATFDNIEGKPHAHGDIVIEVDYSKKQAVVFGGNKKNSVVTEIVNLTPEGKVLQERKKFKGKNGLYNKYIAVVKLMPIFKPALKNELEEFQSVIDLNEINSEYFYLNENEPNTVESTYESESDNEFGYLNTELKLQEDELFNCELNASHAAYIIGQAELDWFEVYDPKYPEGRLIPEWEKIDGEYRMLEIIEEYWKAVRGTKTNPPSFQNINPATWAKESVSNNNAWSAAFVSWVMINSSIGENQGFVPSIKHITYIVQAYSNFKKQDKGKPVWLREIDVPIKVGDILCFNRKNSNGTMSNYNLENFDKYLDEFNNVKNLEGVSGVSHCDIVKEIIIENGKIYALVVGGNKSFRSTKKIIVNNRQISNADGLTVNGVKIELDSQNKVINPQKLKNPGSLFGIIQIGVCNKIEKEVVTDDPYINNYQSFEYENIINVETNNYIDEYENHNFQEWEENAENIYNENLVNDESDVFHVEQIFENYEDPQLENEISKNSVVIWLKETFNKLYGVSLPLTNKLDNDTISIMNKFQRENGLTVTTKINPQTERALLEKSASVFNSNPSVGSLIANAKVKIEDWTNKAVVVKSEITSTYRNPSLIFSLVLHQMAFSRTQVGVPSDPNKFLKTGAQFCILKDGRIIQLHSISRMIWHAQRLSHFSVGVEFEGNFPNVNGKWWKHKDSKYYQKDIPSKEQYESGRFLIQYLKAIIGIRNINAHRQSSNQRTNDPGPHIWKNVGEWAIQNLGMTDGGTTAKVGTGSPIDPLWRNFDDSVVMKELVGEFEYSQAEFEDGHNFESYIDLEGEDLENEDFYELEYESEEDMESDELEFEQEFYETEIKNLNTTIVENRRYAKSLGWEKYITQINNLLLPFSGQNNVSLGEEAFARALELWQGQQGFGNNVDGVLGPNTWKKMKQVLSISTNTPPSTGPVGKNIFVDNKFYAQGILDTINAGFIGINSGVAFNPKMQLQSIVNGLPVNRLNPHTTTIQILPILYHICQEAMKSNYKGILIGSFMRAADKNGKCGGHCAGRCIDINFSGGSFSNAGATQMVVNILNYMKTINPYYAKNFGFGLPFQGSFFKNVGQPKFKATSPNNIIDNQLKLILPTLGIVFPDNDNHLHIQVKWL